MNRPVSPFEKLPKAVSVAGRFLLALGIGVLGGWVFWTLHAPLPWMLGPMLACGIGALLRLPIAVPAMARPPMTALIGTMLGTSFGAGTFANAAEWVVPIMGLVVFVGAAGTMSYAYFRTVGGLDQPTAFFAGMPGGLVEMVTLGGERGGDERMIALIHAARIFLVVLFLPFLIQLALGVTLPRSGANPTPLSAMSAEGALWFVATFFAGIAAGRLLRLPARYMFGPLIVSALVHYFGFSDFKLPTVAVAAAQIVIGSIIGCRFAGTSPKLILKVMALSIGSTVMLLALTFGFAFAIARLSGESFANVVLAYSPGGLAEMSLIALALSGEVAFVVLHHIIRVALVVALSTVVFRVVARNEKLQG